MKIITCLLGFTIGLACSAQVSFSDFGGLNYSPNHLPGSYFGETSQDSSKRHSPRTAVLLSLVPGGGQIYNHLAMPKGKKKAYWKVPLIYAGLGATGYFLINNQSQVSSLKKEYTERIDQGVSYIDPQWQSYDNAGVLTLHNQYQTYRDLSILGFAVVYILNLVDAGVEAHFVNFDVSEDLSMRLTPTVLNGNRPGIGLSLNFR